MVYEPHPESGYPHAHLMVFASFTDDEEKHIKDLWHDMTGPDQENGVNFNPVVGIKHLIAYVMKYISKTLYHTIHEWTLEEWVFNAIAHEKCYRLFGASNKLSEVMKLKTNSENTVECLNVFLDGLKERYEDDAVKSTRIWLNPKLKRNSPMFEHRDPVPASERIVSWMARNNETFTPAELAFRLRPKAWKKGRERKERDEERRKARYDNTCPGRSE